jgi:hypothetical protein
MTTPLTQADAPLTLEEIDAFRRGSWERTEWYPLVDRICAAARASVERDEYKQIAFDVSRLNDTLRTENARLQEALEKIIIDDREAGSAQNGHFAKIARTALSKGE